MRHRLGTAARPVQFPFHASGTGCKRCHFRSDGRLSGALPTITSADASLYLPDSHPSGTHPWLLVLNTVRRRSDVARSDAIRWGSLVGAHWRISNGDVDCETFGTKIGLELS